MDSLTFILSAILDYVLPSITLLTITWVVWRCSPVSNNRTILGGAKSTYRWAHRLVVLKPWRRHLAYRYPFQLWIAPEPLVFRLWRRFSHSDSNPNQSISQLHRGTLANSTANYGFFIYPDTLIYGHLLMAIVVASGLGVIIGPWIVPYTIGIYYILFRLIHVWLRRPVDTAILVRHMPGRLDAWWPGLADRIDIRRQDWNHILHSHHPADHRLRQWLSITRHNWRQHITSGFMQRRWRPPPSHRNSVQYGPESPQAGALMATIASFFHADHEHDNSGLVRLIFYWLSPVWLGYFCLYLPIFAHLHGFEYVQKPQLAELFTVGLLLATTSLVLFWSVLRRLRQRYTIQSRPDQSAAMPLKLYKTLSNKSDLPALTQHRPFLAFIGLIQTAVFSIYLAVINTVMSTL